MNQNEESFFLLLPVVMTQRVKRVQAARFKYNIFLLARETCFTDL